jgi:hypothetical protein
LVGCKAILELQGAAETPCSQALNSICWYFSTTFASSLIAANGRRCARLPAAVFDQPAVPRGSQRTSCHPPPLQIQGNNPFISHLISSKAEVFEGCYPPTLITQLNTTHLHLPPLVQRGNPLLRSLFWTTSITITLVRNIQSSLLLLQCWMWATPCRLA